MKDKRKILLAIIVLAIIILIEAFILMSDRNPSIKTNEVFDNSGVIVKSISDLPNSSSTQEYRRAYVDFVSSNAENVNKIEIKSCLATPKNVSVKELSDLEFVNKDLEDHLISFAPGYEFIIKSDSSYTTKVDFGGQVGVFPFNCGSSTEPVGVVYVTE